MPAAPPLPRPHPLRLGRFCTQSSLSAGVALPAGGLHVARLVADLALNVDGSAYALQPDDQRHRICTSYLHHSHWKLQQHCPRAPCDGRTPKCLAFTKPHIMRTSLAPLLQAVCMHSCDVKLLRRAEVSIKVNRPPSLQVYRVGMTRCCNL